MKKSVVVVLMLMMFAGSAFASQACKNGSKAGLLSSTKDVVSSSTTISSVRGSR